LGERGLISTVHTDGSQFHDPLSNGQQINDIAEGFPLESAIKSSNNDNFAKISKFFTELDNGCKELAFIDGDHIVLDGFLFQLLKVGCFGGFYGLPISR
jgi:hypothetical protein